jgi:tetratricopeptide (TPR) repeat protein
MNKINQLHQRKARLGLSTMAAVFGACGLLVLLPQPANALSFAPTQSEWATWPDYCRARFVVSGAGTGSEYSRRVSPAEVARQRARVGEEAWHWLHHYCAALAYTKRIPAETNPIQAKYLKRDAEENFMGQYSRISKDNWMFPQVAVSIAQMHRQNGDLQRAMDFLTEAMAAQPKASSPYVLAAIIYRDNDQPDKAIEVLLQGNEATGGESAELRYVLGLTYMDVGNLDEAVVHAREAYRLGYPLPGLARKLKRAGRSLAPPEEPVASSKPATE